MPGLLPGINAYFDSNIGSVDGPVNSMPGHVVSFVII